MSHGLLSKLCLYWCFIILPSILQHPCDCRGPTISNEQSQSKSLPPCDYSLLLFCQCLLHWRLSQNLNFYSLQLLFPWCCTWKHILLLHTLTVLWPSRCVVELQTKPNNKCHHDCEDWSNLQHSKSSLNILSLCFLVSWKTLCNLCVGIWLRLKKACDSWVNAIDKKKLFEKTSPLTTNHNQASHGYH